MSETSKITKETLTAMELHEVISDGSIFIRRVIGGWIYQIFTLGYSFSGDGEIVSLPNEGKFVVFVPEHK